MPASYFRPRMTAHPAVLVFRWRRLHPGLSATGTRKLSMILYRNFGGYSCVMEAQCFRFGTPKIRSPLSTIPPQTKHRGLAARINSFIFRMVLVPQSRHFPRNFTGG